MRLDRFGHAAGGQNQGGGFVRPLLFYAPDDPVDRVHRTVKDPSANALVGAPRNDMFGRDDIRRRKLRGPSKKRVGGDHHPWLDYSAQKSPISGNAVVGGSGSKVDDDCITLVYGARRERVCDSV